MTMNKYFTDCVASLVVLVGLLLELSVGVVYAQRQPSGSMPTQQRKSSIGALGAMAYLVESVEPGGAAGRSGLRAGEIVMRIKMRQFSSHDEFMKLIEVASASDFKVQILRTDVDDFNRQPLRDLSIAPIPPDLSIGASGKMVFIIEQVTIGAPASNAGLRRGDMIVEVNGKVFSSVQEFMSFSQAEPGASVRFRVFRPEARGFVKFDVEMKTISPAAVFAR